MLKFLSSGLFAFCQGFLFYSFWTCSVSEHVLWIKRCIFMDKKQNVVVKVAVMENRSQELLLIWDWIMRSLTELFPQGNGVAEVLMTKWRKQESGVKSDRGHYCLA